MIGLNNVEVFANSGEINLNQSGTVSGSSNTVHKQRIAYGNHEITNTKIITTDIFGKYVGKNKYFKNTKIHISNSYNSYCFFFNPYIFTI